MRKSGVFLLSAVACLGVFAEDDIETTHTIPVGIYSSGGGLYLTAGATRPASDSDKPSSADNNGNAVFRLKSATYGMSVSEPMEDFNLGDWCTNLPIEDGETIDWVRTGTNLLASAACKDEGRIMYNKSATNDYERVMFTRGGKVTIDWYVTGEEQARTRTYMVSWTTPERPYRLFWTENGFDGPVVSLAGSNGQNYKHVRLFGDPSIVVPTYGEEDSNSHTSNIVYGVVVDSTSRTIRAYAQRDSDLDRGNHPGPRGQFVLAYYDSGTLDNLIQTIVVEVEEPDVAVLEAEVGDRVQPTGEGYTTDFITANIIEGDMDVAGDAAAPYLYKHSGQTDFSPKNGYVYAIAPNDAANQDSGKDSPHKADIYWQSTDPMGTLWPFEHDRYLIRWGNPRKVVTGGEADPGCGIFLPSKYDGTTTIEHYSTPARIASVVSNTVQVAGAGKFLIKLIADDNIWFMPLESVMNTDTNYFERTAGEWHVGMELQPRLNAAAGAGEELANLIDATLPGYIYASGSKGRNWNPRLYHAPRFKTAAEEAASSSSSSSLDSDYDPYSALESAIYAVNVSDDPIEVWWFSDYMTDDMTTPLRLPTSAQLYKAIWSLPEETHSIVLASQLGSAGESLAATGQALYLNATNSMAGTDGVVLGNETTGATFGFWINPGARAAGHPDITTGRLVTLANEQATVTIEQTSATQISFAGQTLSLPTDNWTHIALVATTNNLLSLYMDGELAATSSSTFDSAFVTNKTALYIGAMADENYSLVAKSATGIAIDHVAVWPFALTANQLATYIAGGSDDSLARLRYSWTFDNKNDIAGISGINMRFAQDDGSGNLLLALNCLSMGPGGPAASSGMLKTADDIAPRVYYENDSDNVGWNPNEEHAFIKNGVTYALRCDLNRGSSSEPFVLVEYNDNGKGAMKAFNVELTNSLYQVFESSVTVGNLLAGPHPLDYLDGYYNTKNFCLETSTNSDSYVVYRDRHNRMWARRDGTTYQFNYYPVQDGFYFPSLQASAQPETGTLVGWLSCLYMEGEPSESNILNGAPEPWHWKAVWPEDDKVPVMRVGQVLSTADSGLPEVWNALSMAVVYPVPRADSEGVRDGTVVTLIDPTAAQTAPLEIESNFPSEYSFTVGPAGTCQLKSGKYYFSGLPPNISDRFYIDTNAAESNRMVLVGKMVEKSAGTSYLQINTLSANERQAIKDICKATGDAKEKWDEGVEALATAEICPSQRSIKEVTVTTDSTDAGEKEEVTCRIAVDYSSKDHYALVANGCGTNYVTLIENDSSDETQVPSGSTISMHVIKVVPELYAGSLVVLQDPNNKLSEQLNILYTTPLGDSSDNYTFEWRKRTPPSDSSVPAAGEADWDVKTNGVGATSILLGGNGANLSELVNTYYEMRYKPLEGTEAYDTVGDVWSGWCGPTLAEGWVQRILNNITPFAQRMSDFYSNAAEIRYTMPEQIGGPYRGDVALNDANLNSVGLVELYQTVLNKAESLSLSLGINDANANKQLMEAVSRLADLYTLLGDDAYSDAVNPTIETSSVDNFLVDYDTFGASTYCFANQVPSLLDEELALLRGRTAAVAPNMTTYPYYNRLMWNFTKGITQGEMAYVQNYGIAGSDGEITAEQAAKQYPMGHGDAYGHYLCAVWGYYRLLRNPWFEWGDPSMMEMLVADSIVNMDYEDEQKFASAAAKMAQTGADVVDLTARKTWRDQNGSTQDGYFDGNEEQGFGYGEWAVRTGLGAFYNWATVNSLLPTNETASVFEDKSIADITRSTVPALSLLAENFSAVDTKVNTLDAGLNPLGLSDNAIPFDIDPALVAAGTASHFEQILSRAERALDNAQTVLDYANRYGARLRQISAAEAEDSDNYEELEAAYKKDLIAIYGTPYPDDIGPSGTYQQGYDGPDLYHYNYMDLAPYGLEELSTSMTTNVKIYAESDTDWLNVKPGASESDPIEIEYTVSSGGILVKPSSWTSQRLTEGSIQSAYRDYISAYVEVFHKWTLYDAEIEAMKLLMQYLPVQFENADELLRLQSAISSLNMINEAQKIVTESVIAVAETGKDTAEIVAMTAAGSVPWVVAGLAVGTSAPGAVATAVAGGTRLGVETSADIASRAARIVQQSVESTLNIAIEAMEIAIASQDRYNTKAEIREALANNMGDIESCALDVQSAYAALVAAEAAYRAEVEKGQQLLAEREMMRKHQSNTSVARRYQDMYYRVQKNAALSKFNTSYDVAQRYVWQLAKVYDYETGLLSSDALAGEAFLREIVATRALGEKSVSIVADGTDGGLWDIVTRMKGNWEVLKNRLDVNNPDTSTKWFSLRYSLFRIDPGEKGDAAWRKELAKYVVDDVYSDSEVARYCQPPAGRVAAEPGFIIPFETTINLAENFFGKPLLGGETTYPPCDYAVRINSVGVDFTGYDALTTTTSDGLAVEPNIYLVPVGRDYMRTPGGTSRKTLAFRVVDQVLPLPYSVGSTELNDADWIASFSGMDGTVDSTATIRRHSTMRAGGETTSTRLVGRSVWNDRWILVIPASSLSSDRSTALKTFINGLDSDRDGKIDIPGVADIRLGINANSRGGN